MKLMTAGAAHVPEPSGESPAFATASALGPMSYVPGRGLRIGSTGLVIGGFTNIKGENTKEAGGEFALDTLNVFLIFDRFSRFRAVAELQLRDIFTADGQGAGAPDFAFDVRRLFGEFTIADELRLRAGTFLTPFGYWNLLRAPPLTWTTEPPLIVEETFFQATTTGLMLHGSTEVAGGQLGCSLFSQFLKPLENDPDLVPPDLTAGVRIEYDIRPAWSAGATYQAADDNGSWSHLAGVHLLWQHQRGEILSELYFQDGRKASSEDDDGGSSSQRGTYLQGVLEVHNPFYLVGRYEHVDPPVGPAVNVFTVGGVWKPFPFMAIKVEYRVADHGFEDDSNLDGFFSSFTTLF